MNTALIDAALDRTSRIFHKEADLQQELAWQLHKHFSSLSIRAEYPVQGYNIDLWVVDDDSTMAVELKYPKQPFQARTENESFSFGNDATDIACHSYLKDITRLESLVRSGECDQGAAVILTNNPRIWDNEPHGANYDEFMLYEGRTVSGTLAWPPESSESGELAFDGEYELRWQEYTYEYPHPDEATERTSFKYCIATVGDQGRAILSLSSGVSSIVPSAWSLGHTSSLSSMLTPLYQFFAHGVARNVPATKNAPPL